MRAPASPSRRGPRRALSEAEILDAALALLDEGGPAAASIRGIAARVGVAPNAVYTYFPGKPAVMAALVEQVIAALDEDDFADRSQPWRLRVEGLALAIRRLLTAHPAVVPLMVGGSLRGPHAAALHGRLLQLLADAGLHPADATRSAHLLLAYVVGSTALAVTDAAQPGPPAAARRTAAGRRSVAGAPTDQQARATTAAATGTGDGSTEQYLWGLHRLLDGLTATTTVFVAPGPHGTTDRPREGTAR